jgi:hypothetical protein
MHWNVSFVIIGRNTRPMVAFSGILKALNLLHWVMCAVTYRRIAMAINLATFLESFVDCCLFFVALAAAGAIWS